MGVIAILWLREVKRYLRSRPQIIASLAQPLLYLLVLGFGLGPVFQQSGQGSYLQFIAPGVIGMGILFTSIFSGIGLLFDRQFGFLKETLVAPVPRLQIMVGPHAGRRDDRDDPGHAGARGVPHRRVPAARVWRRCRWRCCSWRSPRSCSRRSARPSARALKDMQGFQLIMNFLVMPIFFLSGALFPLTNLPSALTVATRLDPLAYGVDGLRGAFIGVATFGLADGPGGADAVVAAVFLLLGARAFSRIQI